MNKVLNMKKIKKFTNDMIYIGRPTVDTIKHFGNPFSHLSYSKASVIVATREESISAFKQWIDGTNYKEVEPERRLWILNNLDKLKNKDLVCWCSPLPCHGDVYLELIKNL
jgi:hypothetical protein